MGDWNLGDAFDIAAKIRGDEDAVVQGDSVVGWNEFRRRARNVAAWMLAHGATHQGKVAIYTYNDPAYLVTLYAAFSASLVAVNVNYRYREEELAYLLANADAEFVVVHHEFAPLLAAVLPGLPQVRGVLVVGPDGAAATSGIDGAHDFSAVAATDVDTTALDAVTRSGDDLMFLYTGGTTGMPKGVMWRQDDLYCRLGGGGLAPSPDTHDALAAFIENPGLRVRLLAGPPLMHGTGLFTCIVALLTGGTVVLLDDTEHFDPDEFWRVVDAQKTNTVTIVGDSFAKPLLRALQSATEPPDISSIVMVVSSGVMWSKETKEGLLAIHPGMLLVDVFSSSEALGMGTSIMSAAGPVPTAKFSLSETTRLFDEDLKPLDNAPGVKGLVGVGRNQPLGYYKDPEKSARTFTEVDGVRFSIPGDWAVVADDGVTLDLLGRGSVCINTGGEKVFPEEVEEVVKRLSEVRDCVVVAVPDDKWGQAITAVCSPHDGDTVDPDAVVAFVKEHLAGYKAPKHVVVVDSVYRSPSGKADYKHTLDVAIERLGAG